jgi:SAM-dependent methyltransferase
MTNATAIQNKHWFRAVDAEERPSPWWYFGRAVYVSRRDYRKIFYVFISVGIPLGAIGVLGHKPLFLDAAYALAVVGILMLIYSLIGLYRMYGHPAVKYLRQLLKLGKVEGAVTIADLHIGTYRHAFTLSQLLPQAQIYSVDCWSVDGPPAEAAVQDVRDLEAPPNSEPRITPMRARDFALPLEDASCDVVVFGFGTHEVPTDGPRQKLFSEAIRVLKPKGKLLLFEHGFDFHNYLIFGPVIGHVTRLNDWMNFIRERFDRVRYERSSHAVDLITGVRRG